MSSETATREESRGGVKELAGKYLTFALADEEYGISILKVREIIGLMEITAVPQTPPMSRGSSICAAGLSLSWNCAASSACRPRSIMTVPV